MISRAKRLSELDREVVSLYVDETLVKALAGDTILTALLLNTSQTGTYALNHAMQAGFCLMGACQSCWVWTTEGEYLRACDTQVQEGLQIFTKGEKMRW